MPPDAIITTYKDFLKHRDILHYYQFNIKVLEHLIHLTLNLWCRDERISRLSLIQTTRRYAALEKTKKYSEETCSRIFNLFKIIIIDNKTIGSKKAVASIEFSINTLLRNVELKDEQISFLLGNLDRSLHIVNRILRTPLKAV